jgi:hypothetical protein
MTQAWEEVTTIKGARVAIALDIETCAQEAATMRDSASLCDKDEED